jgi:CRISPR-associated protein Csm5
MSDRRSITRVTLRAIPLTPIHVGDGQAIRLDEYFIEEPGSAAVDDDEHDATPAPAAGAQVMLCRFDQGRALRSMMVERRAIFRRFLDQGNLGEASKLLRKAGRGALVDRIALSDASRRELQTAMDDPGSRGGQVNMFIRSGGRPFIPGSSIKGAFRTALASAGLPTNVSPTGLTHDGAMRAALKIDPNDTATDPLRFLSVADAKLPDGATRIDPAEIVKRGGAPATTRGRGGIQMHYERLRARSDGAEDKTSFVFSVGIDSRLRLARADLFQLVSGYHWDIWRKERELFFTGQPKTTEAMDRVLRGGKTHDGRTFDVGGPFAPNFILLRLGRFGHFESKSLAGVRQGHFPQAKNPADRIRPPDAWGNTRTVTRNKDGAPIPFGWVLAWVEKEETL